MEMAKILTRHHVLTSSSSSESQAAKSFWVGWLSIEEAAAAVSKLFFFFMLLMDLFLGENSDLLNRNRLLRSGLRGRTWHVFFRLQSLAAAYSY